MEVMVAQAEARLCLRHLVRVFGPTLKLCRNAPGADLGQENSAFDPCVRAFNCVRLRLRKFN